MATTAAGQPSVKTLKQQSLRRYGIPVSYIAGERNNIKLTTPEDLSLAEAILRISG